MLAPASGATQCFGAPARDPVVPCDPGELRFTSRPSPNNAVLEPAQYCRPIREWAGVCAFGSSTTKPLGGVLLVGDSHGEHWRGALTVVAKQRRWRGYSMTRNSCPFEFAQTSGKGLCTGYVHAVIKFLRAHSSIQTVVASQNRTSGVRIPPGLTFVTAKINGFRRAWAALPASVRRVIVLRDVPRAGVGTKSCVTRLVAQHRDPGVGCARPRRLATDVDLASVAANRSDRDRAVSVDFTSIMCDPTSCFPVIGGALVIKDIGHLTTTFSRTLGPALDKAITEAELAA